MGKDKNTGSDGTKVTKDRSGIWVALISGFVGIIVGAVGYRGAIGAALIQSEVDIQVAEINQELELAKIALAEQARLEEACRIRANTIWDRTGERYESIILEAIVRGDCASLEDILERVEKQAYTTAPPPPPLPPDGLPPVNDDALIYVGNSFYDLKDYPEYNARVVLTVKDDRRVRRVKVNWGDDSDYNEEPRLKRIEDLTSFDHIYTSFDENREKKISGTIYFTNGDSESFSRTIIVNN